VVTLFIKKERLLGELALVLSCMFVVSIKEESPGVNPV
jgi:hypothetical protein